MPYPLEYALATQTFLKTLEAVREETSLATDNQAYTVLEGVLQTFRRRLTVQDALRFADALPVALRAMFVHDWDVAEPRQGFPDDAYTEQLAAEVRALRSAHNSAPDTAVADVARALRRIVDATRLDAVLAGLPDGAAEFWRG